MKRRFLAALTLAAVAALSLLGLAACDNNESKWGTEYTMQAAYEKASELGYSGTLEEFIASISGADGVGIASVTINSEGELIVTLTDDTEINCGYIGGESGESFYYCEIKQDGKVTGYTVRGIGSISATEIVVPDAYRGKPVIGIGDYAFADCTWLTDAVISEGVKYIGDYAFSGCTSLKSVTIPDSVTSIGEYAFENCPLLESVTAGKGLKTAGAYAFAKCGNLKNVYITDAGAWGGISFETLSSNPLYFAENLYINNSLATDIVIDTAAAVGDYAFYECGSITSVVIGSRVNSIGEYAFSGCAALKSAVIGDGVTSIGECAFSGCEDMESLKIGGGVKTIGGFAFFQCFSVEEITVPASVQTIGESAFTDCTSLKKLNLNEGLKSIGDCAFGGCSSLESLIMPNSVTSIGFGIIMFGGGAGFGEGLNPTNNLTKLVMSNSITEITDFAFSYCNISEVRIGGSVSKICYSAFYGCSALKSIVMPKSVKSISSYAFYRVGGIESVYYEGAAEEWKGISIGKNGNELPDGAIYYYSETKPTEEGNYWRYVDGEVVEW